MLDLDHNQFMSLWTKWCAPSVKVSQSDATYRVEATVVGKILVWGESGGIGAATARAVAANGFLPDLVGRDVSRLQAVAAELGCGISQAHVEVNRSFACVSDEIVGPLARLVYAVGSINLRPFTCLATTHDFGRDLR